MSERVTLHVCDKDGRCEQVGECEVIDNVALGAFILENVEKHYELRVVDMMDNTVMNVIDQVLVFPVPGAPYFSKDTDAHVPADHVEQRRPTNKWDPAVKRFVVLKD